MIEMIYGFFLGTVATSALVVNRMIKRAPESKQMCKQYGFRKEDK